MMPNTSSLYGAELPTSLDELSSGWLTRVLDRQATLLGVEPMDESAGLLGTLGRIRIDGAGLPPTLIAKLPSADGGNRRVAERFGYYIREAGFYRELAPTVVARVPRCWGADVDGRLAGMLLEDMAGWRDGDQVAGATLADAEAAMDAAASLHASLWDDGRLAAGWLPSTTDEEIAGYEQIFELTHPVLGDRVSAGARAAMASFAAVCRAFAEPPATLVHGDFRLDNLMFDADGRAAVIDFQVATAGRGPTDVARFLSGSCDRQLRSQHAPGLVERYHAGLVTGGVTGYGLDDCWRDVRLGWVINLPYPVSAAVAVKPADERGRRLLDLMVDRTMAAFDDLGVADAL